MENKQRTNTPAELYYKTELNIAASIREKTPSEFPNNTMKKIGILLFIITAGIVYLNQESKPGSNIPTDSTSDSILEQAYQSKQNNLQVEGSGTVVKILSDDNEGSRHQRFILRLKSGQTLLIAHNIDIAPRLEPLSAGDRVSFFGEYEWNNQGGVIHWTHPDPNGRHIAGWIRKD